MRFEFQKKGKQEDHLNDLPILQSEFEVYNHYLLLLSADVGLFLVPLLAS
jgi:hypothetical protein